MVERQSYACAIGHRDQRLLKFPFAIPDIAITIDATIRNGLFGNSAVVVSIAEKDASLILDGNHPIVIVGEAYKVLGVVGDGIKVSSVVIPIADAAAPVVLRGIDARAVVNKVDDTPAGRNQTAQIPLRVTLELDLPT